MQLRIWNEVATIFLVSIVFLVVLKDLISMGYGLIGLFLLTFVLGMGIKLYRKKRKRVKHLTNESSIDHLDESKSTKEDLSKKQDSFWKENLTELQYRVTRQGDTEYPRTGFFDQFNENGEYFCSCCGEILFKSENKFDAGCGWPRFLR